jgi:hypothetical protein
MYKKFPKLHLFKSAITLSVLFLLCAIGQVRAAIMVENVTQTGEFAVAGVRPTAITLQHEINGLTRVLYVGVSNYRIPVAGPTPCGLNPALITATVSDGTRNFDRLTTQTTNLNAIVSPDLCSSVEVFRLTNPTPGTNNIMVTIPAGGDYVVVGAISFVGVDQTMPVVNALVPNQGSSSTPNVTVSTVANDLVLDVLGIDFNAKLATPSQTLQYNGRSFFGALNDIGAGSTQPAAGSSVTMQWTLTDPDDWALGATVLKPLGATASFSTVSGRVLTQSGRGVSKAFVYLTDSAGKTQSALSNPFGYFQFKEVRAGETYVLSVSSKRYSFTPQTLNVVSEFNELNFTAQP